MAILHTSASPSHYNKMAEHYDQFNEKNSEETNRAIEKILREHNVRTVLDLTCGTGSQVFWLAKKGFEVLGFDINLKMVRMARAKGSREKFAKGDIRTTQAGMFDAVITIFNAVGHLTKSDFAKAIRNIYDNLKQGGVYIFDIFNLSYLLEGDNITKLTIDWLKKSKSTTFRQIQYSTITTGGVLTSYDICFEEERGEKVKCSKAFQTLQVYTKEELLSILKNNGFRVIATHSINGGRFSEKKTERILTVAKKV